MAALAAFAAALLRWLAPRREELALWRPEDIEWAIEHGHAPPGTRRIAVLDDGQWVCE